MSATAPALRHGLSIDVEDWYHDGGGPPGDWATERVVGNTERVLDLLAAHGARATFFFLGDVAMRYPDLVRRVAGAGHEIGSHGYGHRHLSELLWREFRDDVARSLAVLEDIVGAPVLGFRAPYFAIKAGVRWPISLLGELGLRYDSSILAIDRLPGLELVSPRAPFRHANGLWEVPVAVLQILHFWHLPAASGAGLRLLPPRLLRRGIERFERDVGTGLFYLHPWELDPESPTGPGRGRWLLRLGRAQFVARLESLLRERQFVSIREAFPVVAGDAECSGAVA
jgi:polysaccharide deacetylase family protein (PEP-CTERM system associated)